MVIPTTFMAVERKNDEREKDCLLVGQLAKPITLSLSLRRALSASALPNSLLLRPHASRLPLLTLFLSPLLSSLKSSISLDLPAFDACTNDSALHTSNRAPLLTPPPPRPHSFDAVPYQCRCPTLLCYRQHQRGAHADPNSRTTRNLSSSYHPLFPPIRPGVDAQPFTTDCPRLLNSIPAL
ncbi:hypothetical protein C8R43DRAFT_1131589 [Mycena crocata]|nr:hypothetical protein C8R43DRAFT_1131589 [Mycena crocata]